MSVKIEVGDTWVQLSDEDWQYDGTDEICVESTIWLGSADLPRLRTAIDTALATTAKDIHGRIHIDASAIQAKPMPELIKALDMELRGMRQDLIRELEKAKS